MLTKITPARIDLPRIRRFTYLLQFQSMALVGKICRTCKFFLRKAVYSFLESGSNLINRLQVHGENYPVK